MGFRQISAASFRMFRRDWSNSKLMFSRLGARDCVLFICDVQTRLLPEMWEAQRLERNIVMLSTLARRLEIPALVSQQNTAKIGATTDAIQTALGPFSPLEKMRFSAWEAARAPLEKLGRKTVLLCGLESHICVAQTALDLLENGYTVFGIYDAISSRQAWNRQIGWERMKGAGVVPSSTESAIYEILGEAGTDDFRAMLSLVK